MDATIVVTALDRGRKLSASSVSIISLTVIEIVQWIPSETSLPRKTSKICNVLNTIRRMEPVRVSTLPHNSLKYCFHIACECGHDALIRQFFETVPDSLLKDPSWLLKYRPPRVSIEYNAMKNVIIHRHVNCLVSLLNFNPGLTKMTERIHQVSALHYAAGSGNDECMRVLLSMDPGMIKVVDVDGWNALH
eukprot:PhF_6_TR11661/c4_g1_i1/m.18830